KPLVVLKNLTVPVFEDIRHSLNNRSSVRASCPAVVIASVREELGTVLSSGAFQCARRQTKPALHRCAAVTGAEILAFQAKRNRPAGKRAVTPWSTHIFIGPLLPSSRAWASEVDPP